MFKRIWLLSLFFFTSLFHFLPQEEMATQALESNSDSRMEDLTSLEFFVYHRFPKILCQQRYQKRNEKTERRSRHEKSFKTDLV